MSTDGRSRNDPIAVTSARVPSTRDDRIAPRAFGVQRVAIGAPARCTTPVHPSMRAAISSEFAGS